MIHVNTHDTPNDTILMLWRFDLGTIPLQFQNGFKIFWHVDIQKAFDMTATLLGHTQKANHPNFPYVAPIKCLYQMYVES